jgi:hypothetical protein
MISLLQHYAADVVNCKFYRRMCYKHTKALGGRVGLKVKTVNYEDLSKTLLYLYTNRMRIGSIKTDNDTFNLWRRSHRPFHKDDDLGAYRFPPRTITPFQAHLSHLDGMNVSVRQNYGDGSPYITATLQHVRQRFGEHGTVGVRAFDKVLADPRVKAVLDGEFDMYRYHARNINGAENLGWLRNMYHGLLQQFFRSSLRYYVLYVYLRPDRAYRLISYPYYTKYASKGDKTFFRHIDMNIDEAIQTGRGLNMIQGSVSLTSEDTRNCTQVVPGLHKPDKLRAWMQLLKGRKGAALKSNFIHAIKDQHFTQEDAVKLGLSYWTSVPCERGEVRITHPALPHGSTGPMEIDRKTILPWFVEIQEDHSMLEVPEGGTWEELSAAHRDLTMAPKSPSGKPNIYGGIPYTFPASCAITTGSAVSDALLGRRKYTDVMVVAELYELFGKRATLQSALALIERQEEVAIESLVECWEQVKVTEARYYGRDSWWRKKEAGEGIEFDRNTTQTALGKLLRQQELDEAEGSLARTPWVERGEGDDGDDDDDDDE